MGIAVVYSTRMQGSARLTVRRMAAPAPMGEFLCHSHRHGTHMDEACIGSRANLEGEPPTPTAYPPRSFSDPRLTTGAPLGFLFSRAILTKVFLVDAISQSDSPFRDRRASGVLF